MLKSSDLFLNRGYSVNRSSLFGKKVVFRRADIPPYELEAAASKRIDKDGNYTGPVSSSYLAQCTNM
jgi:hypothetical protein